MSKQFFCELCGQSLVVTRKALKYRQEIVELVKPHTCDPDAGYLGNITDTVPKPNSFQKVLNEDLRKSKDPTIDDLFNDLTGDKRDPKHLHEPVITTAPQSIIELVKNDEPSVPEGELSDL